MSGMTDVPAHLMKGAKGYKVDPDKGLLIGIRGNPITARDPDGYIRAIASKGVVRGYAHRVIWQTVHGDLPEGMQINHKNGIKSDNRIQNLELCTAIENHAHAVASGLTDTRGVKNGRSILTPEAVRHIRGSNQTHAELSSLHGVSTEQIRRVRNGTSWSSVT